ncbi:hypothetical protein NP493_305g01029 [Ridgeia piscesae]|uniref:LRRNT domain-containing protein n=1 Tax=Ridgeia piscesae TaxID=27915 RepID=A0AAD9L5A0_RIDPI|nr:hypothetical protein NP493_305g01029 [Ridgeia piscesae]
MRPSFMMAASLRYFYTSFVVLTALFVTIGHGGNYKCPSACSCLGSMVDCSKQGLTSVPDDLPIWVTILELSFNGIPEITNGTFKDLYKLEEL